MSSAADEHDQTGGWLVADIGGTPVWLGWVRQLSHSKNSTRHFNSGGLVIRCRSGGMVKRCGSGKLLIPHCCLAPPRLSRERSR
jgi:hypothetical protein